MISGWVQKVTEHHGTIKCEEIRQSSIIPSLFPVFTQKKPLRMKKKVALNHKNKNWNQEKNSRKGERWKRLEKVVNKIIVRLHLEGHKVGKLDRLRRKSSLITGHFWKAPRRKIARRAFPTTPGWPLNRSDPLYRGGRINRSGPLHRGDRTIPGWPNKPPWKQALWKVDGVSNYNNGNSGPLSLFVVLNMWLLGINFKRSRRFLCSFI